MPNKPCEFLFMGLRVAGNPYMYVIIHTHITDLTNSKEFPDIIIARDVNSKEIQQIGLDVKEDHFLTHKANESTYIKHHRSVYNSKYWSKTRNQQSHCSCCGSHAQGSNLQAEATQGSYVQKVRPAQTETASSQPRKTTLLCQHEYYWELVVPYQRTFEHNTIHIPHTIIRDCCDLNWGWRLIDTSNKQYSRGSGRLITTTSTLCSRKTLDSLQSLSKDDQSQEALLSTSHSNHTVKDGKLETAHEEKPRFLAHNISKCVQARGLHTSAQV